jgi:hypothetical protein
MMSTILALFFPLFFLYMTPTIVACAREHRQTIAIAKLNILLGWTVIGWVSALAWALTKEKSLGHDNA